MAIIRFSYFLRILMSLLQGSKGVEGVHHSFMSRLKQWQEGKRKNEKKENDTDHFG